MTNPMLDQLEYLTNLMKQIDNVRGRVDKLPPHTQNTAAAKRAAKVAGSQLFDAVTEYQRCLLNDLYRPGAISERVMEQAAVADKEVTPEVKKRTVRKR